MSDTSSQQNLHKELSRCFTEYMVTYLEVQVSGQEDSVIHEYRLTREAAAFAGEEPQMDVYGSRAPEARDPDFKFAYPEVEGGWHRVCIDVDFPIHVVPSRTQGHFHLYFSGMTPIPWEQYERFLKAAEEIGLIQPGYYQACKERKETFLRIRPDVELKGNSAEKFDPDLVAHTTDEKMP